MPQIINQFPESTNQSQSHVYNIPKLKSVTSVTSNTGSVTYIISGKDITLNFTNGTYMRSVQTGGSYYPGDSIYVEGQTSSYYNSGGYSGTLTQYVYSGSYTAADTKNVTLDVFETHSTVDEVYTSSGWVYYATYSDPLPNSTGSYSQDGYTGTLSVTRIEKHVYPKSYPANPTIGQHFIVKDTIEWWQYSGTVTRPESDTRVYRYHGTVYSAGYDTRTYAYYYQYTATINYTESKFSASVKVGGVVKTGDNAWVKVGGVLKEVDTMYVKIGGVVKEI